MKGKKKNRSKKQQDGTDWVRWTNEQLKKSEKINGEHNDARNETEKNSNETHKNSNETSKMKQQVGNEETDNEWEWVEVPSPKDTSSKQQSNDAETLKRGLGTRKMQIGFSVTEAIVCTREILDTLIMPEAKSKVETSLKMLKDAQNFVGKTSNIKNSTSAKSNVEGQKELGKER